MTADTTEHRTNGRKTTNDALVTQLPAGVIATFGSMLGAGIPSRSGGDVK